MDQAALDALYPSATPAPAAAPVAPAPQPAATAPATPTPAPAAVEETLEQRLDRVFASPEQKAAEAAAAAKPADPTAPPDFIDQAHWAAPLATPIVQELGLGREQVAKLETLHQQMSAAAVERQTAAWGAEAAQLPADIVRDAQAAVKQFATPQLRDLLNRTGLGNSPEMIRFAAAALRSNPFRR